VESGEEVRISVADNGCGIAPEDQSRIFEPFFSLREGGTGLGLFLSLQFIRRWNGGIRVTSVPGEGATFVVTLPAARSEMTEEVA
jgi:signal transduction histidine kinase